MLTENYYTSISNDALSRLSSLNPNSARIFLAMIAFDTEAVVRERNNQKLRSYHIIVQREVNKTTIRFDEAWVQVPYTDFIAAYLDLSERFVKSCIQELWANGFIIKIQAPLEPEEMFFNIEHYKKISKLKSHDLVQSAVFRNQFLVKDKEMKLKQIKDEELRSCFDFS